MKKRTLASLLCAMMAVSVLASCGNSSSSSSEASSSADSTASTAESTDGSEESTAEEDLREPELVTLDVVTMSSGKNEPDITEVEEAYGETPEDED